MVRNMQLEPVVDYDKNLKTLLGLEKPELKILERSYGLLKGKIKASPVAYQRKIRQGWENRLKKQFKIARKRVI